MCAFIGNAIKLSPELVNLKHIVVEFIQSDRFHRNASKERQVSIAGTIRIEIKTSYFRNICSRHD